MDFDFTNNETGGCINVPVCFNINGKDINVSAVWDTGASFTCINEKHIPDGLTPESYAPSYGANDGEKKANEVLRPRYRANITIGSTTFKNVLIRSMQMSPDAIIGMNIISHCKTTIDSTGASIDIP